MLSNNYTALHVHSHLSNGVTNVDSITKFEEYIDYAASLGMKAFAFSEHGSVFQWVKKKEYIEKHSMKYIHAQEFYVTEELFQEPDTDEYKNAYARLRESLFEADQKEVQEKLYEFVKANKVKVRDNYHVLLIAKNYDGALELNKLSSGAFNRDDGHYYYMPRITFDELINTSDNIIVSTACLGGILNKGNETIREKFIEFLSQNKHRCYLEVQHHNDSEGKQKTYNKLLYGLSKKIDVPLLATTDTHALNEEHLDGRRVLQKAKDVRFADEDSWDLTFKTYDELVEAFVKQDALPLDVILEAIENTNRVADTIEEFELDRSYKYPHLWEDSEKTFQEKIKDGINRRGVDKYPNYQEYLDRIEEELEAYRHNGAIDFMLLMEDIIAWCMENDIYVGYGRGSCNGSVIAWLLGITEMDSIKHKLNFQRFMNVERVSLSDIDTDFPPSRIEDVKGYIFSKTGLYCSDIITFNTIADKGAIRDVSRGLYGNGYNLLPSKWRRAYDEYIEISQRMNGPGYIYPMPEDLKKEVEKVCKDYLKISEDAISIWEKDEKEARKKYPELFKYVDLVKGTIVSVGSHPCGTVVSPHDITDKLGIFTTSTSKYPISQINMKEIDGLNYVKLDLLKLDTIELINETCKLIGIERLTPDNVDINDLKVWAAIRDDTTQIFQWEGQTGESYIKKLLSDENIKKFQAVDPNIDRMTLLSIGNSAIRPAGASYRDDLANGVVRKTGSKPIDDFLSNTFGYLVFQCQIIDFLHLYCGFTMGEADIVRRGFAKKTGTDKYIPIIKNGGYLTDKSNHYIKGYISTMKDLYGIDEKKSEEDIVAFIQVIEDASSYLFSLNHSQPYSYEGYVSGWLRTYYPLEFLTTAFNINSNKEEKTRALTIYANKNNIKIELPKFRYSKGGYFFSKETNTIYKGICSIKFMTDGIANELYEMRNTKFDSFIDVLVCLKDNSRLNSRQLDILIKLNFFEEFGSIENLLKVNELFAKYYGKKELKKEKVYAEGLDYDIVRRYSGKETPKKFTQLNSMGMLKELTSLIPDEKTSIKTIVNYQVEHLGYIDVVDKKYSGFCVVTDINVDYSPKIKLYALANGNTIPVKIDKKIYARQPLKRGDIIKVEDQYRRNKMKKVDGKWVESDEKEWWIREYKVC